MFYLLQSSKRDLDQGISLRPDAIGLDQDVRVRNDDDDDIDFVDDAILNTAPQNPIERQLLTGDMIGLALMSGAIIWSAMGAIA